MPLFVKTEFFKEKTLSLPIFDRQAYLEDHKEWIKSLISSGIKVASGYLVDSSQKPGGGGLLIFEAKNLTEATTIIKNDPMIIAGLVNWKIQEWNQVSQNNLIK